MQEKHELFDSITSLYTNFQLCFMQNKGAYKVLERDIVGTSLDTHSLIAKSYHAHSDRRSSFRHTDYSKSNDIFQVASQMNVKLLTAVFVTTLSISFISHETTKFKSLAVFSKRRLKSADNV